jgi:cobalt transporter subunit CbtB
MQQVQTVDHVLSQPLRGVRVVAGHWPALGVLFFGVTILYFVGFSDFRRAHNAAHDTRHASGFPCH